jgi:outer membrane protein TolC
MVSRFLTSGLLLAVAAGAQTSSFPKASYFREVFSRTDTRVELKPAARLRDFNVGGKLELSLKSYLELVMANNSDIQYQMLSLETPRNAIMRAFGAFDPVLTGSFSSTRQKSPSTNALDGAATLATLSQPARFTYSQTLDTGTNYTATFTGNKSSTNSGFQNFNPALNSTLGLNFTQPLVRNRGRYVNRINIVLARSRLRKTEYDLKDTLLRLVTDAENAYWDVVQARETLRVQESALQLAGEALKRSQRELELGALSPLDIFNPQQSYATAEIQVSQAQFHLQQVEDALRKQMGVDLDPEVRKLPIVLTESVNPAHDAPAIDTEMAIKKAMAARPDLKSQVQDLDIDDLLIHQSKNAVLPDLSLTGNYTAQGRGGPNYQRKNIFDVSGTQNTIISMVPGGFNDALSQMFGFGFPSYSFGLTLRLPIRDRRVAADLADAIVNKRRDALQVRTIEQTVRLDVLNAVSQVESSKAAVKLAIVAEGFSQKYLEAEQKKYELGTSQIFFVLQAQSNLIQAESTVVQNAVSYRRNILNLLRKTGELLDERGIVIQ